MINGVIVPTARVLGEFGEVTLFYTGRGQPDAVTLQKDTLPPPIDDNTVVTVSYIAHDPESRLRLGTDKWILSYNYSSGRPQDKEIS